MSTFWDNNKDSIKKGAVSTLKGAGKATASASKYGYNAGKTAYKNNKAKKNGQPAEGEEEEEAYDPDSATPLNNLKDPHQFPPPPKHVSISGEAISHPQPQVQPQAPPPQQPPQGYYQQPTPSLPQQGYYQQQQPSTPQYQQQSTPQYQQQSPAPQYQQQSPAPQYQQQSPAPQYQQQSPAPQYQQQSPAPQYQQQSPAPQYQQQPYQQVTQAYQPSAPVSAPASVATPPRPLPPQHWTDSMPAANQDQTAGYPPSQPLQQQQPQAAPAQPNQGGITITGNQLKQAGSFLSSVMASQSRPQQQQQQPGAQGQQQQPTVNAGGISLTTSHFQQIGALGSNILNNQQQQQQQQPQTPQAPASPVPQDYGQQQQPYQQQQLQQQPYQEPQQQPYQSAQGTPSQSYQQPGAPQTPTDSVSYSNPYHHPPNQAPIAPSQQQAYQPPSAAPLPPRDYATATTQIPLQQSQPQFQHAPLPERITTTPQEAQAYQPQYNSRPPFSPSPGVSPPPQTQQHHVGNSNPNSSLAIPPSTPDVFNRADGPPSKKQPKEVIVEPKFEKNLMEFDINAVGMAPPKPFKRKEDLEKVERQREFKSRMQKMKEESLEKARTAALSVSSVRSASPSPSAMSSPQPTGSGRPGLPSRSSSQSTEKEATETEEPKKFHLVDISKIQPPPPTPKMNVPETGNGHSHSSVHKSPAPFFPPRSSSTSHTSPRNESETAPPPKRFSLVDISSIGPPPPKVPAYNKGNEDQKKTAAASMTYGSYSRLPSFSSPTPPRRINVRSPPPPFAARPSIVSPCPPPTSTRPSVGSIDNIPPPLAPREQPNSPVPVKKAPPPKPLKKTFSVPSVTSGSLEPVIAKQKAAPVPPAKLGHTESFTQKKKAPPPPTKPKPTTGFIEANESETLEQMVGYKKKPVVPPKKVSAENSTSSSGSAARGSYIEDLQSRLAGMQLPH